MTDLAGLAKKKISRGQMCVRTQAFVRLPVFLLAFPGCACRERRNASEAD
jgi:hypothetical protein